MTKIKTAADLSWSGRLLLRFCRTPGTPDYSRGGIHYDSGKELNRLEEVFPDFRRHIKGKSVIDFGCGEAYQAAAFARSGAAKVIGVEINERLLEKGQKRIVDLGVEDIVSLVPEFGDGDPKADVIVSQNSFEHFLDAEEILGQLRRMLAPGGRLFITFAPPWYAPWGSHMGFYCRLPWVNLLFRERTVMEVRQLFRPDGVQTYREAGLAKMTVAKFERLIETSGLTLESRRYDCIHEMNWLKRTPMRELFVNRVSCVLSHGPRYAQ
jgi:SAM-dependent methyltransferase